MSLFASSRSLLRTTLAARASVTSRGSPISRSFGSSSSILHLVNSSHRSSPAQRDSRSHSVNNAWSSRRGFASSSSLGEAILPSAPIKGEDVVVEATAAAAIPAPPADLLKDTAVSTTDVVPTHFTLGDAANELAISSGTLDLTSLSGAWGPHPIMRLQSMFLNLHESFPLMSTGLPWYILIPTVTVCLRVLLFGFQVRAQSNAARMAIIQPEMLAGMERLKAAKARGDFMGAQTAQMETQKLMTDNNVNPIKNLAFPLAQAAVFMTMFFALRGLATAELPSMMTEGLAWVENLTLPDPYYVLPVASTALTLATLELGVDSTTQVQTSTTKNMKLFFRVMLVFALPFISYFPAALLLYWVTNNSISLLQSLLLKQPLVRSFFRIPTIPPKIQPGQIGYVPEPSFSEAFKNVQIGMADKWEETKEKGAIEAQRQKDFKDASEGIVASAPIYRPRSPMKKREGALERVTRSLSEESMVETGTRGGIGAITAEPLTGREEAVRQFEIGKAKRAEQVRARKLKSAKA